MIYKAKTEVKKKKNGQAENIDSNMVHLSVAVW
jgi:hypothetical protein